MASEIGCTTSKLAWCTAWSSSSKKETGMARDNLPLRQALVAATLAAMCVIGWAFAPSDSQAAMNKEERRAAMSRTVFIMALVRVNGELKPYARGSGSILTEDGAVLTNRHVVWFDEQNRPVDALAIAPTTNFAEEPTLLCLADPARGVVRPDVDLALIKCEADMKGAPFHASGWPAETVGSSEDLVPGDDVVVIGYPGVGGWTVNYTVGKVSGFMGKDDKAGRFWMKTDAEIGSGNSGGSALDEDGKLIGIPTAVINGKEAANGHVGLVRPIELARDLVDLAHAGWQPGQGSGGGGGGGGNNAGNNGGNDSGFGAKPAAPQPQAADRGIHIIGKVQGLEDSRPIRDATVVILKPGIKVSGLSKDKLTEQVLTIGRTDARGQFVTEGGVPRGHTYSVVVVADGYSALTKDDVLSTEGSVSDPFDPWGVITLKRE
jgi:S1-C subfamily serine protease